MAGGSDGRKVATALLAAACAGALAAPVARAQTPPPAKAPARKAPAKPPADDATDVSEVVVTAAPTVYQSLPGAVVGDITPELQLSPADVQSYGVSTVTELLDELAPQTRSDQGRGGGGPVVLLNGRRISGFNEIRDIPTEAILRVDILPEEVALKYGFTADQKVVNFVLRRRFRAITAEATGGGPTAGGQETGSTEDDLFNVRGDDRFNLDLKYNGNSDLTQAARGLTGASNGAPYAVDGNVVASAGGQVDPALSALAGRKVTVAGIPALPVGRGLRLSDFLPTANIANTTNTGADRDLAASNQSFSANAVLARALPLGFSGTINGALGASASRSLQGLPSLTLTVPAGDPYSPFTQAVQIDRSVAGFGPLVQSSQGWTAHLGGTLNKDLARWRLSFTAAYDHVDSRVYGGGGVAASPLQRLLNAGSASFNPFAPAAAGSLTLLPQADARSLSDSGNMQALANGPLLKVPAGQLNASLKVGDSQSGFTARSERLNVTRAVSLARNDVNAQVNLDLPLASKRNGVLGFLGELSVNTNLAVDRLSDFGVLHSLGYGLNWQPIPAVRLLVSHTHDEAAPSMQQLDNPVVDTPGVRLFDYQTGRTVDVTQVIGGNPALTSDHRDVFKVGLTLKPWAEKEFTVTANYVDTRVDNPIQTFPAATAQIEAAFPDRFIRNADGDLVEEDNRPVNFAWQTKREIRWGINYSRPVGKPPPAPPGARRPEPGTQGGQAAPDGAPAPLTDGTAQARVAPRARVAGVRPGGPAGGGRGGFGGGPPDSGQGRFQVAVYHTLYFVDQVLVRPGGPLLDQLNGAPSGGSGGQPVHQVEAQMGYTLGGWGARASANWVSGSTVIGAATRSGTLTFSDLATVNLRLFANLGQMRDVVRRHPWLAGARVTLSVSNLFDDHLRVRDAAGVTPLSYQAAYLDPSGRTASLSLRKLFF